MVKQLKCRYSDSVDITVSVLHYCYNDFTIFAHPEPSCHLTMFIHTPRLPCPCDRSRSYSPPYRKPECSPMVLVSCSIFTFETSNRDKDLRHI